MADAQYHLLDVFTIQKFGGNQLAVFTTGQQVPAELMQTVARELNLSETVFVLPPDDPQHAARLRIFTPGSELPMAGHPTVGTGYLMAKLGLLKLPPTGGQVVFEEGVGPIPVDIQISDGQVGAVFMQQPLPHFGPTFDDGDLMATLLSLTPEQLHPDLPVQMVSCGVPFWLVPLANKAAVAAARLRLDLWEQHIEASAAPQIFIFSLETDDPQHTVLSRMFAPSMGIAEDPATGAASGPLGSYLVHYGAVQQVGRALIVSEQGVEMGRPSLIQIEVDHAAGVIRAVRVGGHSVYVGHGTLTL